MSVIDFYQPYSFDANQHFGTIFYAFQDRANYEIYDATSQRFVVTLDNAVGGVKYVEFLPQTSFTPFTQGFKSGVVETMIFYGEDRQAIASFDQLQTSLQSVFAIPGVSFSGFAGADVLGGDMDFLGSDGNDSFSASDGTGYYGAVGNDTLNGAGGNDTLYGDAGDDVILGGAGNDRLYGESGIDVLYGQDGDDYLDGGADGNLLHGGAGNDSLYGGAGTEFLIGGAGNDILSGGGGLDRVFYDEATSGISLNLALGSAQVVGGGMGTDTLLSIEDVTGSNFNDVILGSDADNVIWAGYGDDSITGGLGNDDLSGGVGNDTLIGGDGNDTLTGFIGSDYVDAGDGDDVVVLQTLDLTDTLIGGAGTDILRFDTGASPVYPTLNFSSFEGLGFQYFRSVVSLSDTTLKLFGVDGSGRPTALIVGGVNDPDGMGGQLTIQMSSAGALDLSQLVFTNWSGMPPSGVVGPGRGLVGIIGTAGADTIIGTGEIDSINGGAGADNLSGGVGDDTLESDGVNDVLDGGAGDDMAKFNWSALSGDVVFDGGVFSVDGVDQSLTLSSIERIHIVSGAGADLITGLGGADYVKVDGLNDTLDGGAGTDALEIDLSAATQALTLSGASLLVNGVLSGSFSSFESFKFQTGTGNDSISGGNLSDEIESGNGNDTLDGGAGGDVLVSGDGDDTYIVDNLLDEVYDIGSGADTIQASVSWSLYSTGCENLVLTGTAALNGYGSSDADSIFGNIAANALYGESGNDTLNGGAGADTLTGGSGADSLIGGLGDDTYVIDASDVISEAASSGLDTIKTWTASYSLGLHGNIENLTFTGAGNFSGTGNAAANVITGGAGADVFNGGAGADTLVGGLGNDTYVIAAGDVITEALNGGVDTVRTLLSSYGLGVNVENLVFAGAVAFSGIGNGLANTITGAAGADTLDGGLGADTLKGGFGNDTYVVNGASDVIVEAANAGADTVLSSGANFILAANIENLTLLGAANTGGTGNALNNVLRGNAGNNNLLGQAGNDMIAGGAGNDVLYGGAGADNLLGGAGSDAFVLNTAIGAGQVDRFSDFSVIDDTIRLENAIFTKFAATGGLNAAFFRVGAATADANDYIIYNSANGALFYDANGNAAGGAVQIATLSAHLALTAADFVVI